jgi:WD40 repeat protein
VERCTFHHRTPSLFGILRQALWTFEPARGHIWDARSGQPITTLKGDREYSAAFSPDGSRIVTASDDRTARIWDARSGEQIACIVLDAAATALAFSHDGLALGDDLGRLSVFDTNPTVRP